MRILVAEDDRKLAQLLRQALAEQGHAVDVAHDGESAYCLGGTEAYDLMILDIMLPNRSGSMSCGACVRLVRRFRSCC